MVPAAPSRLITAKGWPRFSDMACARLRALMSSPPPAAKGTIIWIGREG
jgi:hypothetical protein